MNYCLQPEEYESAKLLFDRDFFVRQIPAAVPLSEVNLQNYLSRHDWWSYSPHPLFDGAYYLAQNADVRNAGVNPLVHFLKDGGREGRDPHPMFDARFYCGRYLDTQPELNPLVEYLTNGASRGKLPYPGFDYDLYRREVSVELSNVEIAADFFQNYFEERRQVFAKKLIRQALAKNTRAELDAGRKVSVVCDTAAPCEVVIPVKNAVWWVAQALHSVLPALHEGIVSGVILVDDGSTEQSRAILERLCSEIDDPRVRVLTNAGARGFAGSCNFGFAQSSASRVLLLNSDCLATSRAITKMSKIFESADDIGLVCPLSNNAANVTVPLPPGMTFKRMDQWVEQRAPAWSIPYPEICTIVGHCLMVSRQCFNAVGGIDESWGLGYGEESDFHLRARARGFRGVVANDTYVYHFGGGTFRDESTRAELQSANYRRFMELWGEEFSTFLRTAEFASPVRSLSRESKHAARSFRQCDVLFVLPGLTKGVGGVQVVIDLCNYLIMKDIDARVVVLGAFDEHILAKYTEPIFFNLYHAKDEAELMDRLDVEPKVVVATLFATTPASYKFAAKVGATLVNFVQGYEFYFDNGCHYENVRDSYLLATHCLTTSRWLAENVKRKAPSCEVKQLPLGIDLNLFNSPEPRDPESWNKRLRIGMVLRSAPDKGQFVLRELCDLLFDVQRDVVLTIFLPENFHFDSQWSSVEDVHIVRLPVDRTVIARELQSIDIFVDASLHEGYGLFPLEAMACGACVIASDSGGVTQFLENGVNGVIISAVNKPENYLKEIRRLLTDRKELGRLQANAFNTAQAYSDSLLFAAYEEYFRELLQVFSTERRRPDEKSASQVINAQ